MGCCRIRRDACGPVWTWIWIVVFLGVKTPLLATEVALFIFEPDLGKEGGMMKCINLHNEHRYPSRQFVHDTNNSQFDIALPHFQRAAPRFASAQVSKSHFHHHQHTTLKLSDIKMFEACLKQVCSNFSDQLTEHQSSQSVDISISIWSFRKKTKNLIYHHLRSQKWFCEV